MLPIVPNATYHLSVILIIWYYNLNCSVLYSISTCISQVLPEYGRRNVSPSVRPHVLPSTDHALSRGHLGLIWSFVDPFWPILSLDWPILGQ